MLGQAGYASGLRTDRRIVDAFAALGFEPIRHSYRMEIDLADEHDEPAWPDGITVRTAGGDHRPVYAAVIEAWQDTNDPMDETFEEWAHWRGARSRTTPRSGSSPYAGDELAGFSICRQDPVDPNAGYVGLLGVRRAWRRRASARRSCATPSRPSDARGFYTRGTLGVDASSVTGATRLYERAGMRVYRDTVFLERPVGRSRRESPARPLSRLPHVDGGRDRPRVPVPRVRARVRGRPRPGPARLG